MDQHAEGADVKNADLGRVFDEQQVREMCTTCTESISKTGNFCVFWAEADVEVGGWPFVACAGKNRDNEMLKYRVGEHPDVKDISPETPGVANPICEALALPAAKHTHRT